MQTTDAKAMATDADIPASERMDFVAPTGRPSWLPKQIAGR
jgi:hypothetical protein